MPRSNRRAPKEPPCVEGAKQVSPGQSDAAQTRSAALGKRHPRTSVALKGRDRCATNASKTRETVRRKRPNANVTRHMADSLAFDFPVEARASSPSIHSRFAMIVSTSGSRSCRAPSGRWIFGGLVTQGGAPRLRRVALPWAMAVAAPSGHGDSFTMCSATRRYFVFFQTTRQELRIATRAPKRRAVIGDCRE